MQERSDQFYKELSLINDFSDASDVEHYHDLSINSDYRKFDDMLRVVITGETKQRQKLEKHLDRQFETSKLAYGIHITDAAMVTCMVFECQQNHIHFVDGSNGGYVMASRQLKEQTKELNTTKECLR